MAAATSVATSLGLAVRKADALHESNKLTLRLLPCDVVARVAPAAHQVAQFELDLAQQLLAAGSPVAAVDPRVEPRVYEHAGFVVTLWTYYEPVALPQVSPAHYADALAGLHVGMRDLDLEAPHVTRRVEQAQLLIATRDDTPALSGPDRELLAHTLEVQAERVARRAASEQLLHGEPHPGNLLNTKDGPLFVDFETCCRGPVEFDIAHAPDDVSEHYPDVDHALLRDCRLLVLAMITTWRWERGDQLPRGRELATGWLAQIRGGGLAEETSGSTPDGGADR